MVKMTVCAWTLDHRTQRAGPRRFRWWTVSYTIWVFGFIALVCVSPNAQRTLDLHDPRPTALGFMHQCDRPHSRPFRFSVLSRWFLMARFATPVLNWSLTYVDIFHFKHDFQLPQRFNLFDGNSVSQLFAAGHPRVRQFPPKSDVSIECIEYPFVHQS